MGKLNECEGILNLIQQIIDYNILVIVEGKKDKKALEGLGVKRIVELEAHHSLVEKIDEKEVVLLVDLDKEGKKIYGRLKDVLSRRGVKVNDKLRHYLFRDTQLRQVEGLATYLNSLSKTF